MAALLWGAVQARTARQVGCRLGQAFLQLRSQACCCAAVVLAGGHRLADHGAASALHKETALWQPPRGLQGAAAAAPTA